MPTIKEFERRRDRLERILLKEAAIAEGTKNEIYAYLYLVKKFPDSPVNQACIQQWADWHALLAAALEGVSRGRKLEGFPIIPKGYTVPKKGR